MNVHTYLQRVASLSLFFLFSTIYVNAQCAGSDGAIIVNSTADEGLGTLRDAINCANITEGPSRIVFELPVNEQSIIRVGSTSGNPLPSLLNPSITIDGTTQPGFGENGNFKPLIVLDGSSVTWDAPINALKIFGDNAEIYGLEIRNFPDDGIDITNAENVIIGDEEKGNVIYNCGIEQDFFPATGNQGPYNGVGIVVTGNSDNATITNNIIGTDYESNDGLGNEWAGIYVRNGADFVLIENNTIVGNEIGVRLRNVFGIKITENQISCNSVTGIEFDDGANDDKAAPIITDANNAQISGTGSVGDEIEVYIAEGCGDTPCQGSLFLGRAVVSNDRNWTLNAPFANNFTTNQNVTALAIDSNDRTSTFSDCRMATVTNDCASADGIILVTNTNDEGTGSLRAAIICANDTPGPNTIQFNISGSGRQQINIGSANGNELPFLRDAGTIIDGTTQPGFGENGNFQPLIVLDGGSYDWRFPHNAIWIRADSVEIYGLEVRNFPDDGIDITGGDNVVIGAPNKGNVIYNCGAEKDIFEDAPPQNVYNGCGIVLKNGVQNSVIQSNIIGTDYTQTETIGNELCGIIIQSNGINNLIGGSNAVEGNIIAHNPFGISLLARAYDNQIVGNSFYCNSNNGIELSSDANNNQVPPNINVASISVINGTGTNGETIEVYVAATDCSDTPCQGSVLIGRATVVGSTWRLDAPFLNNVELQGGDQITALSTSSDGATSEFSECRTLGGVEPPPNCSLNLGISNFNNETCAGNDGTFTLTVSNATEPIAFDFGDGATQNPVFSNLTAGSYSVTATDAQGCTAGLNVTISQDPTPALSLVSTDNENCGSNDGSFTVVANGGQAPYIYELDNGFISRTPTFGNLTAGDYTVSVVDANNCIATETLTIQQIGNVNVTIADMQNDVCNNGSGSFKITPSGGQAPYTYNAGNGTLTSNEFTGLSAGVYSVTVADANNCSTIATVNIESGTPPVASISGISQATCSQTGSVSIAVAGGRAPFQFNIGEGDTPQPTFSNLVAGNYVVTVTDANNCSTTQVVTIEAPESPTLSLSGVQIAACGNANGLVIVQSTGGLAPYTYDIGQGLTDNNNFSGLAAGNYTVTVYDANSCTDEIEVTVDNSPTPTLSIATMQDASCNLDNGMITVAGTGVAPLSYDIGNGASDSPTFSNLAADTYTITLTDGNNCVASATIELKSSGGPQINVQSTSEARCDKDNGSFSVNAFGGFPPYTYDIGNGPTNNPEFVDLPGGNYTVTLTDNNGCTASQTITLGNLPAPTFGIGNITDATCGEPNGGFNVSAFGGRAPYQFNIGGQNTDDPVFTDLNEGTYTVVVTDANNCSTALNVTVEGTPTPEVSVTNELVANCGATDGGFDLNVTGGVAPYFFDLGNGESTNSAFRDLAPGAYDVTITDASNCSQVKTVKVQGSADIELSITNNSPATCGIANGQFTVNASGGQTPYTYSINGATATSTATFDNLEAGTYEIRTTDVNGCFALQSVAIDEGDGPTIEVEVTASCGDETAVVNVTASQGQTPYTYDIGEGPTSVDVFRSVAPGLYQVKVVDATGCESSKNISVNISTQEPAADIDILQQPGCAQSNGSIKVNVTRGIPPYVYQMSETEISPFATFSNLSTGNYEITVIDAGGCSTMVPISLGEDGGAPTANFDFNFANFDGSFTNTSQNGTTYTWEFGDGTTSNSDNANHTYATDGTYSICLTATNDCGSDTFCQNHTIQAQNTNKSIEFDFGEISGQLGETVKIPVYVLNFNQAVGFQKSVVIEDPSVAKIVGVSDVNLKDLAAGLFNINDSQFTVAWFEGAIEGVNLPDSTIIYQIEVELLADNACTGVLIADDPLETQVYKKDGNSEVTVDYFTRVGRVCVGEGGNTSQNSQLSGLIMTEDGMAVSEVTVNCTNTPSLTNKLDGTYVFEDLVTPATYTVTPKKNDAPINGVSTFDMVIIQNHILGNERLDSPYKLIAADANNNGRVTVADIIELRKLLLLEISELPNTDAWRFVDASYEFPDPTNPFEVDFPESVTVDLNADSSADFIGIKIGDVNNTAAPNRFTTREERSGKNTFWLNTDDVFVREGESTLLTIIGQQLANISGLQYTLSINPEAFAIEEVYTDKLFKSYNIGQQLKNRGFILASWLNTQKINQAELFSIKITARRSAKVSDFVKITDQFLTSEAYGDTNQEMAISLTFNHSFPKKHLNFSLAQNHPNPFAKNTVITYQLPRATAVELSIFDLQGQRILSTFHEGTKGQNEMVIAKESLPLGGVYYYQLKTPFGQATKKMIVLD